MNIYKRGLANIITEKLSHNSAVAILGPRQIGKTTLAFEISRKIPSIYLDIENPEDLQKLQDPPHYFELHSDKLIILDEIQRYPDLFMYLRGVIDKRRREGRGNGRFLLLGSASNDLLKQTSESLAGRIVYLELTGLNLFEIEDAGPKNIRKLWVRGGFPNSYMAGDDLKSNEWRKDFIKTYLERDIPLLGYRIPATTLMRFWQMLAHSQGEILNASKFACSLGVESVTIVRYLDLMSDILLVRRLEPWHGNVKKRLVKSPRIYVRDSGIIHTLLQIPNYEQLLGHPVFGKSWEGFVIEKIISILPPYIRPFFYRTSAGAEIDLLLELGLHDYWAVEIKSSRMVKLKKGFHIACEDLKVKRKFVIYTGEDVFAAGSETIAISLAGFLQEIKNIATK